MAINDMNNPVIQCDPLVFSKLFYKGKFQVPWHQRHYDWEAKHVLELLQDIEESVHKNRGFYFLGAIILVGKSVNGSVWEINDGQQRMVTFSLVFAYLARCFAKTPKHHRLESLCLRVLFNLDENTAEKLSEASKFEPRIMPPRDDAVRYRSIIQGMDIGMNGKLTSAWAEIEKFFDGKTLNEVENLFKFLIDKVEVARLYLPEGIDPNAVFETINCRGKALDDFDLIRNHLYSYFNNSDSQRKNRVYENINTIRQHLKNNNNNASEYTRCFLQCQYGAIPKSKFYRETRDKIDAKAKSGSAKSTRAPDYVYGLLDDLASQENIEIFQIIKQGKPTGTLVDDFLKDSGTSKQIRNLSTFLQELKDYTITQPIVFSLLRRYSDAPKGGRKILAKTIHKQLNNFTSFVMRTVFVGPKFESSRYEKQFSDFAYEITSAKSIADVDFDKFLRDVDKSDSGYGIMDDGKFIATLGTIEVWRNPKAKLFLFGINHHKQTDRDLIKKNKCTVEHILPKSDKYWSRWAKFNKCNPQDHVCKIGNLTLLSAGDNKSSEKINSNFSKKKDLLGRSALAISNTIDCDDWSPEEINKRQERLIKAAKVVWAFK